MEQQTKSLIKAIDLMIEKSIAAAYQSKTEDEILSWHNCTIKWLEARKLAYEFLGKEDATLPR